MESIEDEIRKKMLNIVEIVIETYYFHMNMNLFVLFVDIT